MAVSGALEYGFCHKPTSSEFCASCKKKHKDAIRELKEKRKQAEAIKNACEAVVRAAKAWVNFVDDGLPTSLAPQVKITERLARAVARLEKLEGK